MPVAVERSVEIRRPRPLVAAYAADPDNASEWYENIKTVEWRSPRPLEVGSRVEFTAEFLGRRLTYVYEVRVFEPGERLVMTTADGPFPMETTYEWTEAGDGATHMTLRNRGEPSGFVKMGAPMLARAMSRANGKDLERLKQILETRAA